MKRFFIFILMIIWTEVALLAQESITLNLKDQPITEVIKYIEKQSGYTFSYSPSLVKTLPPVTFKTSGASIEEVLELIFGESDIQPFIQGRYIILRKRPKAITISGFIYDAESHESLIAANIYDLKSRQGAVSNNFGFYSLSVPPGEVDLRPSYVGYDSKQHRFFVTRDTIIHFFLLPSPLLQEIIVEGNKNNPLYSAENGKISLQHSTLKAVPALMSENDVIKALQHVPGVATGVDGLAGLYVRGGNADENLYLVDGNPLYHVHHLLGLFSTFNPEAVKTIDFYKGSFPARYGGRLSSVVDVRLNDGDMKKFSGSGSIGLISSRFNLQGPIIKDKTSFSASFRRTYVDLLIHPAIYFINRKNKKRSPDNHREVDFAYYFYDFNAKFNHKFSERSRLFLSLYDGKDKLFYNDFQSQKDDSSSELRSMDRRTDIDIGWGNRMISLNWTYMVNAKLFSNSTLVYSRYRSDISHARKNIDTYAVKETDNNKDKIREEYQLFHPIYRSGIKDIGYRLDFDYAHNNRNMFRFGTSLLKHNFRPEESRIIRKDNHTDENTNDTITYADEQLSVHELSFYAEDEMDLGKRWKINAGVHLSGFFVKGKSYINAQPRLTARYLHSENLSFKASYARMAQYVHLLQNSFINTPNDLWVPITENLKPLLSQQISLGVYTRKQGIDLSAEAYYKKSHNQVEYKDDQSLFSSNIRWEERIAQGMGTSYGFELMASKRFKNTSGWVGYTLSWANRQFPGGEINKGKVFPAKFDNRHKINAVISHQFNRRFDINLSWIYATGNWTTIPLEEYIDMDGHKVRYYEARNNYKMPDYQRLDLSINYYRHKKNGRMGIWNFSVYNLYAHHNSFIVVPSEGFSSDSEQYPAYQSFSLFPIIPSFSYTYKF